WIQDRPDHDNLMPWFLEFGRADLKAMPGTAIGSACRTLDQLRRWFTEPEYRTLIRCGYQAVRMEVSKIIAESAVQCLVERHKPFSKDCEVINLYPTVTHQTNL